jgi:hypothetical protein
LPNATDCECELETTERLVAVRQEAFTAKYGVAMGAGNVWLQGRHVEIESLNRILLSFNDITPDLAHVSGFTVVAAG